MSDGGTAKPGANGANGANGAGALAGLKVVDLTRVLGGPYCTQILADHGAEVLKVEPPQGDEVRHWGPPYDDTGTASYFVGINRNKRGLALDLTQEAGRAVLLRLLEDADVLIENLKVGTLEKWGLGYEETLRERFPRLIYCRISGYGGGGPLGGFPGYDAVVQAAAGMMSVNGPPDGGATRLGIPIVDMGTGLMAANGILMAVIERQRSGQGQMLDMTLFDCAVALLHPQGANALMSGRTPGLTGNAHPNVTPYDKFQTGTCEIFLAVGNNRQFARLCDELGKPDLAEDPRFAQPGDRTVNREALRADLEILLRNHDGEPLCERLMRKGVPAGPVLNISQVIDHPHTQHREMVVEMPNGQRTLGIPVKLSRTPGAIKAAPPTFGADNRAVLEAAGYAASEIDAMIADGVVLEERR